ncbi:condensation domain-containing protein [Legionella sainthelensi]|uniref:condensation domain-containing protein n=1 Tax=Legionella sainthelensi TaxID=28087 RepID=UPI000F6E59F5|nr:condensation domain-containing protein [Legionella sainthelensi]VEH37045.1 Condensation domain [Legionella sainthelensi]
MAKTCSANYVDRLLMKINGAICPIWNSLFYTVEEAPCSESFFSCVNALINEAPRLKSIWSKAGKGWQVIEPDSQKITDTYRFDAIAVEKRERIQTLIQAPIDLEHSLPFRITIGKIFNNEGFSWIIAFQIHHAASDGQSLIHFVERFWDLLNGELNQHSPSRKSLSAPKMTDKKFIRYCLKIKKYCPISLKQNTDNYREEPALYLMKGPKLVSLIFKVYNLAFLI